MRLNRMPCEVCKEDTLHRGWICLTCKTVKQSPTAAGYERYKKNLRKMFARGQLQGQMALAARHGHRNKLKQDYKQANGETWKDLKATDGPGWHQRTGRQTPTFRK